MSFLKRRMDLEMRSWLWTPYLLGGSTKGVGSDCSNTIRVALNNVGVTDLPESNVEMLLDTGRFIPANAGHISRIPCFLFWTFRRLLAHASSSELGFRAFFVEDDILVWDTGSGVSLATAQADADAQGPDFRLLLDTCLTHLRGVHSRLKSPDGLNIGDPSQVGYLQVIRASDAVDLVTRRAAHHIAYVYDRRRIIHSATTSRFDGTQWDPFSFESPAFTYFTPEYLNELADLGGITVGLITGDTLTDGNVALVITYGFVGTEKHVELAMDVSDVFSRSSVDLRRLA